jgi:hypothetical protein
MDNDQKINNCTNEPSSQTFRSYFTVIIVFSISVSHNLTISPAYFVLQNISIARLLKNREIKFYPIWKALLTKHNQ